MIGKSGTEKISLTIGFNYIRKTHVHEYDDRGERGCLSLIDFNTKENLYIYMYFLIFRTHPSSNNRKLEGIVNRFSYSYIYMLPFN